MYLLVRQYCPHPSPGNIDARDCIIPNHIPNGNDEVTVISETALAGSDGNLCIGIPAI
jgi:hypothetical protein